MLVTVKKITLWRSQVDNKPGPLASAIEPLAEAGADFSAISTPGTDWLSDDKRFR